MNIYQELIQHLKNRDYPEKEFNALKRDLCSKHHIKIVPTNIQILLNAPKDEFQFLKKKLLTKPVRSIAGVAPVAIMTKPLACPHGKCTMCPGGPKSFFGDVPMSYTGKEPATMRGIRNNYDSYLQVFNRLEQYAILGHNFDKIELIIMGGTFPASPQEYQEEFVKYAFKAMNDFSDLFFENGEFAYMKFKEFFELPVDSIKNIERQERVKEKLLALRQQCTLESEQIRNETAQIRCIALCIETKPDWGLLQHGNELLRLGCTRVELGIQSVYEDVIQKIHRGHTIQDTIDSIRILKDFGFKITGHYMPGLPLTDKDRDIKGMQELFFNSDFRPDMLKIYPCMVSQGTALYADYITGKFKPITADEAAERIAELKKIIPEYCRIMRIQRDVPTKQWAAGVEMTNFRQYFMENFNVVCRCIRCREPKDKKISWDNVTLKVQDYDASEGKEFFISVEDTQNDILIGFARLRFPRDALRSEITPTSALLRELHVYGTAIGIGEEGEVQHRGWGQKLMHKAEEIAKSHGKDKMIVISGIGVREYYKNKLGYIKEGPYMVKQL